MNKIRQIDTLITRAQRARSLGFWFWGKTYTPFPTRVRLAGAERKVFHPKDRHLFGDVINLWLDDEYGLQSIARPIETVLDIGANIGLFSLWARHNFPTARIHAYEPNSNIIEFTRQNLTPIDVSVFNAGVTDENTKGDLVVKYSSRYGIAKKTAAGPLQFVSIADAIEKMGGTVDLIKLDCEGSEWEIMEKCDAFEHVRFVHMEYHLALRGRTLDELKKKIDDMGFMITMLHPNNGFGIAYLENKRNLRSY
jgi:FkbM family methyltransferase